MVSKTEELNKYLKMLMKRRYLFIVVSLVVMSVIAWGSFFLPKKYEASSTVFIEKSVIKDLVKGITFTPSVEDKVRILRYAMLSRTFVTNVLKSLDVDTKVKNEKELEKLIEDFQKRTQISIKGNDLFIVSIRDKDPKLATDYVNTLVRKYVEENVSSKRQDSYGANRFITEQLKSFKDKLDQSENQIVAFRQKRGVSVGVDESLLVKDIRTFQADLDAIRIKRNELSATRDALRRQLKNIKPTTVALMSRESSSEVEMLERRLKQLTANYTDNYPDVIRIKSLIESHKKKQQSGQPAEGGKEEFSTANPVYQNLEQQLYQVEAELEAINAKQRQLHATIGGKEQELRNVPADQKTLTDLIKERDANRQIYEQLLTRQGQAELTKQMEVEDKATTFRVVDPAIVPKKPVSPDRVKMIIMGILAGFIAGAAAVFVMEMFDSSVKDVTSLKKLGYDVLAVIPTIFNQEETDAVTKKDRKVYVVAGCYFALICLMLTHELLELTLIEKVLTKLGLDQFIMS
ncbi:chain length-determining protein [Geobacter hydrogenophilus]|uniref:Chain-length determining protein n=1 Tax=Geobacter hydrogenophilus TaxID=40983 RepID=A0A9W6LE86_9BACT|nr:XrtA system polysaccharide chain length determinant [Geobacter hydrogenophilus]MBT0892911.1 chain length-determining protein [Geobacter hydrogenophilus]GLI39256.1 chain-length determining protein [Geobacter hydrogenophilus]